MKNNEKCKMECEEDGDDDSKCCDKEKQECKMKMKKDSVVILKKGK